MKKNLKFYSLTFLFSLLSITGFSQEKAYPFAVADQAPAYPGCEDLDKDQLKDCTVQKITNHVNTNFNTSVGKDLNIQGQTRIEVQFKIAEDGEITEVRSRSLADNAEIREALQNEANRVVSSLPQMQPGKMKDKDVGIMYSLPIVFAMPEKEKKKDN
ncbi:hypothetical protein [Christiangramia echinicola]|uniref:hypothetical protein n=1 Tax=Christiangramia echinicola TaxID=279359 RepID=UPI000429B5BA|nr:hypothetical protein [Christiangramia echinicola]